MKKKYETILNRVKEYISEYGPVTSAQISDWYAEKFGVKQAPAPGLISSILRIYGETIDIMGFKKNVSGVYLWRDKL
ncbi:MAG: hypothetical protein GOVbin556_11 [Prokaryotic dsDNA virus sp.]|nr:MAG: hypothetical protein GOVbin556_11 [Prokaryotic dsDNA virus sp.]|tara:strand:- start:377 stop:607 length:231 start_codon:yes stop_codon:yes gene_type:complete